MSESEAPQGASAPSGDGGDAKSRPPEENKDARTMGMLAHLLALPLGFVGPLIIWLMKKDEHPFVDDQGKEALNFQILLLICYIVSYILIMVVVGCITTPLLLIAHVVLCIMAAMAANKGEWYRYPFNMRLIK